MKAAELGRNLLVVGAGLALAATLFAQTSGAGTKKQSAAPGGSENLPDRVGTMTNREIVNKFADLFYRQKKVAKAFNTYVAKDYIQHSPMIGDGIEEVIAVLTPMFADPESHFTVRRIIIDGDYAVIMIHADTPRGQGAVVDIFRLEGGKIVEHWDVKEDFPGHAKSAHPLF